MKRTGLLIRVVPLAATLATVKDTQNTGIKGILGGNNDESLYPNLASQRTTHNKTKGVCF